MVTLKKNTFLVAILCFILKKITATAPFEYKKIRVGTLLEKERNLLHYRYLTASLQIAKNSLDPKLREFGYEIDFTHRDSGCYGSKAAASASDLVHNNDVNCIIGPSCTDGCLPVGSLAAGKNLPILSYSCPSSKLAKKSEYPTFVRAKPFTKEATEDVGEILVAMIDRFNWEHIGVIGSYTDSWSQLNDDVLRRIRSMNSTFIEPLIIADVIHDIDDAMETMKLKSRIILLMCDSNVTAAYLSSAYSLGMYNGEYAFITIDFHAEASFTNQSWYITDQIYTGLLNIDTLRLIDYNIASFEDQVKAQLVKFYGHRVQEFHFYDGTAYVYDAILIYIQSLLRIFNQHYDESLLNYLNETNIETFLQLNDLTIPLMEEIRVNLTADVNNTWADYPWKWPTNWTMSNISLPQVPYSEIKFNLSLDSVIRNGAMVVSTIINGTFEEGQTGHIHMDASGDRYPVLSIENIRGVELISIGTYNTYTKTFIANGFGRVVWPGGSDKVPLSIPECGFRNEFCQPSEGVNTGAVVLGILGPTIGLTVLAVLYRIYKNNQYENDLLNDEVVFKFPELEIPELIAIEKGRLIEEKSKKRKKKKKLHSDIIEEDEAELIPADDTKETNLKPNKNGGEDILKSPKETQRNTKRPATPEDILANIGVVNKANGNRTFCGRIRYDPVFVKRLPKERVIMSREIRVEMKEVRDLHCINLNPYTMFCTGAPYVLLLSPVCTKGSLIDILQNEDIHLNWTFRIQFAMDIISGLHSIHSSPIKLHGHLTSSNILIDSRWNCKISDYGMRKFKDMSQEKNIKRTDDEDEDFKFYSLLWTAPENINFPYARMTREGDVYSFGIILSELINRVAPFMTYTQYRPRDYIHFVSKRCIPPFRPHVRLQAGLDGRILDMMRLCWDEFPENRPTIDHVRETMKKIQKEKSDNTNLLDNMIEMMEKYAQGLEQRLREVTSEKDTEKEKFEKVLFRSLPASVATKMRNGQTTDPMQFKMASLLLFQVDDFASFIDSLNPAQSIDLLHDVFTVIDESMSPNMHKVDSYGDHHVICCGMPEKTSKHALLAARCALKIMGSLTKFRFRHIMDDLMRFKIVCHSGPFLAAVVGITIPQYTILGRSVQFATAALQATPTLRILVTPQFKETLGDNRGAKYEETGPVLIKGYGVTNTHYLVGMAGLPVRLRNPNLNDKSNKKISSANKTDIASIVKKII